MKKSFNFLFFLTTITVMVSALSAFAQQAVLTTGGGATGDGGSVKYSIGQVAYDTDNGGTYSVAKGVQQPYEITVSLQENVGELGLVVFPNPTSDVLVIDASQTTYSNLNLEIFDIAGKQISNTRIDSKVSEIDVSHYPMGSYLLRFSAGEKQFQSFKIIKH